MAESVASTLATGTRVGEYEVTGYLGAGGMGTVYAGVHPVIGKRVAIKVLQPSLSADPGMVNRFVREARAVVKIQHRHIIDVFAFGQQDGVGHYFVMPLLDGEPMGARIKRSPMPPEELLPVVEQIAGALDAAHAAGIFHRDLKPDNVFLAREHDGSVSVRVLDFGIAKLIDGEVSTTQTGAQMGTPLFMSPEQWDGASIDHRTDIYALGVLVHHALTGRFPFESRSPVALMNMHANQPPTLPGQLGADPAADPVIARALAKNRDARYPSAGALYQDLAAALSGAPAAAAPPTLTPDVAWGAPSTGLTPDDVAMPAHRRRWPALLAGGLVAAATAVGIAVWRSGNHAAAAGTDAAPMLETVAAPADAGTSDAAPRIIEVAAPIDAAPARHEPAHRPRHRPKARVTPPPDARPPPKKNPTTNPTKDGEKSTWGDTAKPF